MRIEYVIADGWRVVLTCVACGKVLKGSDPHRLRDLKFFPRRCISCQMRATITWSSS